jgi:acyl-CoA oxidase
VAKEMLLKNFGYIEDGVYVHAKEEYQKESIRFSSLLATLSGGRGVLAFGCGLMSLKVLNIATSYAMIRRQFHFDGASKPEKLIMEYSTHYLRLMPLLAKSMVLQDAMVKIKIIILTRII